MEDKDPLNLRRLLDSTLKYAELGGASPDMRGDIDTKQLPVTSGIPCPLSYNVIHSLQQI